MKHAPMPSRTLLFVLALLAIPAGTGRADQIVVGNFKFDNVRITNLADDTIEYIAAGARRSVELERSGRVECSRRSRRAACAMTSVSSVACPA